MSGNKRFAVGVWLVYLPVALVALLFVIGGCAVCWTLWALVSHVPLDVPCVCEVMP